MRRCHIIHVVLLILLIIDFAVVAPMPIQEKHQAGIDVTVCAYPRTSYGKRGDELNELWLKLFDRLEIHFFPKPEESSAARPLSRLPSSGSADGSMPPSPDDKLNELRVNLFCNPYERLFFFLQNRSRHQPHVR